MSLLLRSEMIKVMKERSVKPIDIPKLAKGTITQSQVASILRGDVPKKPHVIDKIAKVLGADPAHFRKLAVMDILDKELETFDFKLKDLCDDKSKLEENKIPLYRMSEIKDSLSKKGYPARTPKEYIKVPFFYGTYAYAVLIEDSSLFPRVFPNEAIILSQDYKLESVEDYGVVRTEKELYIGAVRDHVQYTVVESFSPYRTNLFKKKEILYAHKVVGIYRTPPL